jgi:glutamate synthase domain-containing protein 2
MQENSLSLGQIANAVLEWMALIFVLALGLAVVAVVVMYVLDRLQTTQAIRRNYPVVGRFRYFFEHMGEFFRQYFFAMDREELPFNRAQRSWAYRAAKNIDNTVPFGSTRDLRVEGSIIFAPTAFPTLSEDGVAAQDIIIGPHCQKPFHTRNIVHISGMSYGALSKPAVQALANGARKAGMWLNTGEGGLTPYHLKGGCDVVVQIGTAKYGVRDADGNLSDEKLLKVSLNKQVRMFEIKISQGAKPGKGGILPGEKVSEDVAEMRGIPVGQDSISPNRHREIKCVGDLLDMIARIRKVTGKPVGFKAVLGGPEFLDELFAEIQKRGKESSPDFITVDSCDGGTGAAPMPLMDDVGLPLRESLPILVDKLNEYGLRKRVRVIASGKLITPADVAWALCVGADFTVTGRGFMFSLGCIQALACNKNTCPTGITTHNPKLQKGLEPKSKAVRVADYAKNLEKEVGIIAHSCGVKEPRALSRKHARVVVEHGKSIRLDQLWPNVEPVEPTA